MFVSSGGFVYRQLVGIASINTSGKSAGFYSTMATTERKTTFLILLVSYLVVVSSSHQTVDYIPSYLQCVNSNLLSLRKVLVFPMNQSDLEEPGPSACAKSCLQIKENYYYFFVHVPASGHFVNKLVCGCGTVSALESVPELRDSLCNLPCPQSNNQTVDAVHLAGGGSHIVEHIQPRYPVKPGANSQNKVRLVNVPDQDRRKPLAFNQSCGNGYGLLSVYEFHRNNDDDLPKLNYSQCVNSLNLNKVLLIPMNQTDLQEPGPSACAKSCIEINETYYYFFVHVPASGEFVNKLVCGCGIVTALESVPELSDSSCNLPCPLGNNQTIDAVHLVPNVENKVRLLTVPGGLAGLKNPGRKKPPASHQTCGNGHGLISVYEFPRSSANQLQSLTFLLVALIFCLS